MVLMAKAAGHVEKTSMAIEPTEDAELQLAVAAMFATARVRVEELRRRVAASAVGAPGRPPGRGHKVVHRERQSLVPMMGGASVAPNRHISGEKWAAGAWEDREGQPMPGCGDRAVPRRPTGRPR